MPMWNEAFGNSSKHNLSIRLVSHLFERLIEGRILKVDELVRNTIVFQRSTVFVDVQTILIRHLCVTEFRSKPLNVLHLNHSHQCNLSASLAR